MPGIDPVEQDDFNAITDDSFDQQEGLMQESGRFFLYMLRRGVKVVSPSAALALECHVEWTRIS